VPWENPGFENIDFTEKVREEFEELVKIAQNA
jgi:hypothetical protein